MDDEKLDRAQDVERAVDALIEAAVEVGANEARRSVGTLIEAGKSLGNARAALLALFAAERAESERAEGRAEALEAVVRDLRDRGAACQCGDADVCALTRERDALGQRVAELERERKRREGSPEGTWIPISGLSPEADR